MSVFSDQFNALPFEIRVIACNLALETKIRGLHLEAGRLKNRYETSRKEINETIKFCEHELFKKLTEINNTAKHSDASYETLSTYKNHVIKGFEGGMFDVEDSLGNLVVGGFRDLVSCKTLINNLPKTRITNV